jgi:putative ABC transport system permease protein
LVANIHSPAEADYTALFPVRADTDNGGSYLMRVVPGDRDRVLRQAGDALLQISPTGIVNDQHRYSDIRADYFRQDAAMARMLIGVCVLLLIVTALGIVGLASFWVQQRTRQIGIRRALGATRANILRYFQVENFLIVSGGIALGMAGAYGLNLGLMHWYELPRMPWMYLPVGAIALWMLGQIAVLGPALRAAAVPPVTATRSV